VTARCHKNYYKKKKQHRITVDAHHLEHAREIKNYKITARGTGNGSLKKTTVNHCPTSTKENNLSSRQEGIQESQGLR